MSLSSWLFVRLSFLLLLAVPTVALSQTATLQGRVLDPSGAVVPGAAISLSGGRQPFLTHSSAEGHYVIHNLLPGSYSITVNAKGFAPLTVPVVTLTAGRSTTLDLPLSIAVQTQQMQVESNNQGVSLSPDQNSSAMVIEGSSLDALSDDPDQLQNELQALAGPAAGPNGGDIYIDGFESSQLPPKTSILAVTVNQNPFSAEFDRIGYGRIEIITKPGAKKLHGGFGGFGNDSALDTSNPFLAQQPSYYQYGLIGNVTGPLSKTSAYFLSASVFSRHNQVVIDALNPETLSSNLSEPYPAPITWVNVNPRIDFQLSKNNFMSVRDLYASYSAQGLKVGTLSLPEQAVSALNRSNEVQIGDTWIVSPHLLMEPSFDWHHISNSTTPNSSTPTVTVQGAFTTGGWNGGLVRDHNDIVTLQNYGTATVGPHTLRFGGRARSYRDADYATTGDNGSYYFSTVAAYRAGKPSQYSATVIENPLARVLLFDGSVFVQDDWRVNRRFQLGLGLRYEGQNYIHDRADWGPRLSFAWAPARPQGTPPKTVIRAGYGWFYNRFIMNMRNPSGAEPYILPAIHDNLINQQSYTITDPGFYNPNAAEPASALKPFSSAVPTFHSLDRHFHAALDMQAGIGIDHQIAKNITGNITYLYTQGVRQYMTNNVTAPSFDPADYNITGPTPPVYNDQFQSEGFYRQNELIFSSGIRLRRLTVSGNYVFNQAKSDTQGIDSFPSVAQNPGLDYGRATFGIRHRVTVIGSYSARGGVVIAGLLAAQSGTPYNITIGRDLTGNNQFNARPTYGTCGTPGVIATQYGCLDTEPMGKGERMIPYGVGLGPSNVVVHLRISKVIGVGPRIKAAGGGQSITPDGGNLSNRGIGSGGPSIRVDAEARRRYHLTFAVNADNIFNIVNLSPPNGVLLSPLFNQTQSVASGMFGSGTPGTRTVIVQTNFSF